VQLALDFPHRPSHAGVDFLVSSSNEAAVAWLDRWPDWPAPGLALYGPAGCGKSHLANVWRLKSGALLLDQSGLEAVSPAALADARFPQQALLHLYNLLAAAGGHLLLCARTPPGRWRLTLADLASRLRALPAARIDPPDDALFAALLLKLFADRQLRVDPDVPAYLAARLERSFEAARAIVAAIDQASLAARRRVTVALARQVLEPPPRASEAAPRGEP
jgi:chromosomal replication initiation ATPase DnaA